MRQLQPKTLIDGRLGTEGDYRSTGDNVIPSEVSGEAWEVPATINHTWGFRNDDTDWKSPGQIAFKLVDIVSKGGNYLLNVGPTAEGVIPQASQDILRTGSSFEYAVGNGMESNPKLVPLADLQNSGTWTTLAFASDWNNHLGYVNAWTGANLDEPIRRANSLFIVLHYDECVAQIAQSFERRNHLHVVFRVQANARLIQHVKHSH